MFWKDSDTIFCYLMLNCLIAIHTILNQTPGMMMAVFMVLNVIKINYE
jgi:hypothetical protein